MKIVFAGTPELAKIVLAKLLDDNYAVELVLTKPDKPAFRGMKLTESAVAKFAKEQAIEIYQPTSLKKNTQALDKLKELNPDIMIVVAYGLILPEEVLNIPKYGCINVHLSLLPRWRGAAPIHRSVLAGDKFSGITVMQMDQGLDTGDILIMEKIPLSDTETTGSLHDKLATLGAECLTKFLANMDKYPPIKQSLEEVSYAHKITKAETVINWNEPAELIARRIRAYNPTHGAISYLEDRLHKFWQAEVTSSTHNNQSGVILNTDNGKIAIACGQNSILLVSELQAAGAKKQSTKQYINANNNLIGKQFLGWMTNVKQ